MEAQRSDPRGVVLRPADLTEVDRGGERFEAAAGDTTWVPAGLPHRFVNASVTERLRIFWTYASVDATRTIVATGARGSIDGEHA